MFPNDPRVRKVLYWLTFGLSVVVIVSDSIPTAWSAAIGAVATKVIAYIAGVTGIVAAANVPKSPNPPPEV